MINYKIVVVVDNQAYLYSVQRVVCNLSSVFNLTEVLLAPGPLSTMHAMMAFSASVVSRMSR